MISYVRELLAGAAASPSGVATATVTLAAGADAGDRVVMFFGSKPTSSGNPAGAVTDSRGNTWKIDAGPQGLNNNWCIIASTLQDVATLQAGDTITVTLTADTFGGGSTMVYFVEQFNGTNGGPDKSATSNNASGLSGATGTTAATVQPDEVAIAGAMWGSTETSITPSSYTSFATGMVTGPTRSARAVYQILSAAGAQAETFTAVGTADFNIGAIATYRGNPTVLAPAPHPGFGPF